MRLIHIFLFSAATLTAHAAPIDSRTSDVFDAWLAQNDAPVNDLEIFLTKNKLQDVVPMYQLLRTASDWQKCKGEPFSVPPDEHWTAIRETLLLIQELREKGLLVNSEVVSGYRNPKLNKCAGGSNRSAHREAFALDILTKSPESTAKSLCKFWKSNGERWKMGLSKYPSGRIHIDAFGYRTWGIDGTRRTTFCK